MLVARSARLARWGGLSSGSPRALLELSSGCSRVARKTAARGLCSAASGGDDDGQGVVDGSPFSGKGFMQKATARAVVAGAKALRTVLTRRYNGDVKEAAWSLPMETTVEVMRGVLPQVLDGRLIQLYNEGDEATRAEVTPNPNPRPDTFEHTAARKLRIVALGLARGDRECSLNDGQRPHVRGIRVHVSSTGLHSWRGQLGGRRETAT
jgi:hypothetical protein